MSQIAFGPIVLEAMQSMVEDPTMTESDDFFEFGGNSLMATELVVELEQRLGVPIRVRDVMRNPTPRSLAAVLRAASDDA